VPAHLDWAAVAGEDAASYPRNGLGTFLRAIDGMRDDFREDMAGLRCDVREDQRQSEELVMGTLATFVNAHGKEHDERDATIDVDLVKFRAFVRAAEIAQARRDGALGVFRFVLEQLTQHARVGAAASRARPRRAGRHVTPEPRPDACLPAITAGAVRVRFRWKRA
jgi:hypothetical protein